MIVTLIILQGFHIIFKKKLEDRLYSIFFIALIYDTMKMIKECYYGE